MVWREGKAPAAWRAGIITALYKRKDSKADCGNYCSITLLSVPGKVFTHVFLARIKPLLLTSRRPQQPGFAQSGRKESRVERTRTSGRAQNCRPILALRLLAVMHLEFERPLH